MFVTVEMSCDYRYGSLVTLQCVDMGALVSASQKVTIDRYVQQAKKEGAKVYQACATIPETGKGFFYPPTLITNVQPVSTCVREEVRELV